MQRFASSAFNISGEEDGSFRDGDRVLTIYVLSSDATRQTVKEEGSCEEEEERKRSKMVKRGFPARAKHGITYSRGW